ncbi:hypothetical protein MLD38_032593 [Melastoma candidum]|uniref:Uncharacterized protein n=1 Tax=Melastoma candidum TaxID=119954 RepID=A0ACB9M4A0_9MYRT|nr:hypothetical protein MLD38_032593 [Melastoma candidum]
MEGLDHCDWKLALQELFQGRDAADKLHGSLFGVHEDGDRFLAATWEDLARMVAGSFSKALSLLGYDDSTKSDGNSLCSLPWTDTACLPVPNPLAGGKVDGRGRYKRRKSCHSWSETTPAHLDDGHTWRKYGQKPIRGSNFPRSYYRCTHKSDQSCEAVKQVQQISEEPALYRTTYYGHHTCKITSVPQQFAIPDEETEFNLIYFDSTAHRNTTDEGFFPSASFPKYYKDKPVSLMGGGEVQTWSTTSSMLGFVEGKEGKVG